MERYRTHEGIIVGRKLLPGGDVILKTVGPGGAMDFVARKAQRPSGRSGRLMLFHHVRFQAYHKPERELATLTQAEMVGRLEQLSEPTRYPAAACLGELAYLLASPETAEEVWILLGSGLRGVAGSDNPLIPLVWSGWRMLKAAGLAPSPHSRCGHQADTLELSGSLACSSCSSGMRLPIGTKAASALARILTQPGSRAIEALQQGGVSEALLEGLLRYSAYQVEPLRSEKSLRGSLSAKG